MRSFKTVKELEKFYKKFENQSLEKINNFILKEYPQINLSTNKGIVGQTLEALIGNAPNSNPNPDVKGINVELKVLPLRKISNNIQPKERSKLKSINYNKIINEKWNSADVKKKIEKILFLLYEQPIGKTYKDWKDFVFKGTLFYELKNENENIVQEDWERIQCKVKSEIADQLSEGDSKILGACTSGSGKLVKYGDNKEAKQRSYSLKHSYLKVYYNQNKKKTKYSSLNLEEDVTPQSYVITELNKELKDKKLINIVNKYKIDFSKNAKSGFSLLINRILKVDDKKRILELEENGITIKTIPVNKENKPWEAMSFPKFSLVDLIEEEWNGENEADFKNIINQGYIFIPLIKEKEKWIKKGKSKYRYKTWETWEIGKSVFWKANKDELSIINKEWQKAKGIVEDGVKVNKVKYGKGTRQKNNLLKSSDTEIIHIRPHAKNSKDIDKPFFEFSNIKISWQSFWLNKSFTEKIISKE
ncbi:MutH/Sau3AI family endonuclease [Tenacibaculum ovolyticum]|uniref:MutH/Sau3AI family endonuclease n=1 Tax=Tenacibaculum ovolyticum TaxID=104270 RepID=UPI001F48662A|nr:MutH/Sau3AI family endonuclease [Tenacibaculum ovolyticum]